jgi:short-subunit dehydrogenase
MSRAPILIFGGRSDIGLATARKFAENGHPIQLVGRNIETLQPEKSDIELRYRVPVTLYRCDVLDGDARAACIAGLDPLPEVAVCAVGLLGDQTTSERDLEAALAVMRTNYEGPALFLAEVANRFAVRGSGTLVGISSVAGERGRAPNYVYGSAKAGFTAFLSGLRNRLAGRGVHVVTVLPGFVATRMTEGMKLPRALTASPEDVATAIVRAVTKRRNVIYVLPVWAAIMRMIRLIPESLFKRMKI